LTLFITSEALSGMLARRKVAIIGAGPAGLVASKQLMDMGVVAKIFSNNVGGMWNAQANPFWPAMKTNLSKFTCRFSDHAWPEKTQIFPTQQEMQGYLNEYAAKHVRPENIVLNCKVTHVHTDGNGRFNLVWDDATGKNNCELFDDVVVATGFFSKPSLPGDFSGFKGRVIHSSEYTSPESFAGRNVVVVGASFSSAEIAADVATTASSVRNVVPRPSWMIPRFLPVETDRANTAFLPVDLLFYQLSRKRDGEGRTEALYKKDADRAKTNGYLRSLVGGDAQDVMQQVRALIVAQQCSVNCSLLGSFLMPL
jgi:cation diffusion facilitator CzcD-associated flavoprotein CzcO